MRIVRHPRELPQELRPCIAALGNFDGFHRGHQAVVGRAGRLARAHGLPLAVITTEPHPRRFFRPHDPPFRLTPFRERAILLGHFGVDMLGSLLFDRRLATMTAQDFVLDILLGGFDVRHLVAGFDYRFGRGRAGGIHVLQQMGEMEGFEVDVVEPVRPAKEAAVPYSSSRVRDALREGRAREAADLLGHWWAVSGRVVAGARRGHRIGFPTANLELGEALQPRFGVYAVRLTCEEVPQVREGVANFGRRPTFDGRDALLEVHLFEFEGDLYGRHVRVEFVDFLRPEQRFAGPDELRAQIVRDCAAARTRLAASENARELLPMPTLEAWLLREAQANREHRP